MLEAGSLRGKAYKQVPLAYDDLYMVLPASVEGHSLVYTLDTGAEHSTLNPPFANAYPQLLAAGRKKQHTLTGMGGSSNQNSVELDQLRLSLGNTEVVLKPAIVLLHETSPTSGWAAGNLGDDLLNQAKPFAIDFEKMALMVAR